jgi:hypothetical protein
MSGPDARHAAVHSSCAGIVCASHRHLGDSHACRALLRASMASLSASTNGQSGILTAHLLSGTHGPKTPRRTIPLRTEPAV